MGIGFLICVINLLIAPVSNVLMRLGCQVQGTKDFSRQSDFFFKTGNYHLTKPYLCLVTHSYPDKLVLRRIQYFDIGI